VLATLSTGAVRTTISAKVADAEFNVNENTPNTVPLGQLGGHDFDTRYRIRGRVDGWVAQPWLNTSKRR
jgi:hypothetical protein